MRELHVSDITNAVRDMCIEANIHLPACVARAIERGAQAETSELGCAMFEDMRENLAAAERLDIPVCQDTGMAVVFIDIGQEVHLVGGDLTDAINEGVRRGYLEGYLRCSVVRDPLLRKNTDDNTPAIVHTRIVPGDRVALTVAPKGFGSENMSAMRMLTPAASEDDIVAAVVDIVRAAGGNPCPPMILGVGLGGDFEYCAYLAKKALCRDDVRNEAPHLRALEERLLRAVNETGIGPQGFGGDVTAMYVNIEAFATHIAGLPLAVNVGCYVTRHSERVL